MTAGARRRSFARRQHEVREKDRRLGARRAPCQWCGHPDDHPRAERAPGYSSTDGDCIGCRECDEDWGKLRLARGDAP